ncbi:hypothetical protein MOD24_16955 [Bacillus haynesii]|uniref:hypothetical protein n=1 Tax=Bacillus haynesii TaxID=1925021 RepID=UPI00227E2964|nr:hypothetical protein [Bacillus haynesii]MCY8577535.1 hypothetical protein [Bacillus haynesii]
MSIPFNENLKISEDLSWGMLKYGLCSYFTLAYVNKYHSERFLAIMEYDDELEKEYLVHFLVVNEQNIFIDAEGTYSKWRDAVKDMTDIEFMDLRTKEVNKDFITKMIEEDMGFDDEIYEPIKNFVNNTY